MNVKNYIIIIIDLKIKDVAFGSTVKTRINPHQRGLMLKWLSDNDYKIAIRSDGIHKITAKKIVDKHLFNQENTEITNLFRVYK